MSAAGQSQQQIFYLPNQAAYVAIDILENFAYEKWVSLPNLLVIQIVQCDLLAVKETMNEQSFEIFHREKFFQREGGLEFCRKAGIEAAKLSFYETSEPLSYYSCSKQSPQNILIIENKDTFFDIRQYMNKGNNRVLGTEFGTVIYGAGKGIWKTFADYVNGAENIFWKITTCSISETSIMKES